MSGPTTEGMSAAGAGTGIAFPERVGSYRLLRCLEATPFWETFLAEDESEAYRGEQVWIRRVSPALLSHAGRPDERLQEEADVARTVRHSSILGVVDVREEHGQTWVVYELFDGLALSAFGDPSTPGCPEAVAGAILEGALEGLSGLHDSTDLLGRVQGLAHGNLSPAALGIDRQGKVRLLDVGVMRRFGLTVGLVSSPFMGGDLSAKPSPGDDLFALGAMIHELVTGVPFASSLEALAALADRMERLKSLPGTEDSIMVKLDDILLDETPEGATPFDEAPPREGAARQQWARAEFSAHFQDLDVQPPVGLGALIRLLTNCEPGTRLGTALAALKSAAPLLDRLGPGREEALTAWSAPRIEALVGPAPAARAPAAPLSGLGSVEMAFFDPGVPPVDEATPPQDLNRALNLAPPPDAPPETPEQRALRRRMRDSAFLPPAEHTQTQFDVSKMGPAAQELGPGSEEDAERTILSEPGSSAPAYAPMTGGMSGAYGAGGAGGGPILGGAASERGLPPAPRPPAPPPPAQTRLRPDQIKSMLIGGGVALLGLLLFMLVGPPRGHKEPTETPVKPAPLVSAPADLGGQVGGGSVITPMPEPTPGPTVAVADPGAPGLRGLKDGEGQVQPLPGEEGEGVGAPLQPEKLKPFRGKRRPGTAALTIGTSPTGGRIILDGMNQEVAPVSFEDIPAGEHQVILRSDELGVRAVLVIDLQPGEQFHATWSFREKRWIESD